MDTLNKSEFIYPNIPSIKNRFKAKKFFIILICYAALMLVVLWYILFFFRSPMLLLTSFLPMIAFPLFGVLGYKKKISSQNSQGVLVNDHKIIFLKNGTNFDIEYSKIKSITDLKGLKDLELLLIATENNKKFYYSNYYSNYEDFKSKVRKLNPELLPITI